jgi:hypothetical protein
MESERKCSGSSRLIYKPEMGELAKIGEITEEHFDRRPECVSHTGYGAAVNLIASLVEDERSMPQKRIFNEN